MLSLQTSNVAANDAVLVLNFDKDGLRNPLGGATFLKCSRPEISKEFYLYKPIPESIGREEVAAMEPTIIDRDLGRLG